MADELVEASMGFDLANVRPFLDRIAPLIESGFGGEEIECVVSLAEDMAPDDEQQLSFDITYLGAPSPFRIGVFMDDIASPDLYFFAPAALAAQISAEMESFSEELGI